MYDWMRMVGRGPLIARTVVFWILGVDWSVSCAHGGPGNFQ